MAKKRQATNPIVIVAVVILFAAIVFLSTWGENHITGQVTVQTIARAEAGSELFLEVKNIPSLHTVTAHFSETVTKGQLLFATTKPTFEGKFYHGFTITGDDVFLESIDLTLKVDEQELNNLGISAGDLQLFHQDKELELTLIRRDRGYLYYTSTSPSLGEFTVGKQEPLPIVVEDSDNEEVETQQEPQQQEVEQPQNIAGQAAYQEQSCNFFKRLFGKC